MHSIKPGRGPSAFSAVGGIIAVVFGIFWTIMAYAITKDAPFPLVHTLFPLFGVCFVIMGIAGVIYNLTNTTAKDRYSAFDITASGEESDPLNERFGRKAAPPLPAAGGGAAEDRLRQLDALRAKGLITESEHQAKRQQILDSI